MSSLLFLVLTELSPGVAILVLNGVFFVQTAIDICTSFRNRKKCCSENCDIRRHGARHDYAQVGGHLEEEPLMDDLKGQQGQQGGDENHSMTFLQRMLGHNVVKIVALLLQLGGLVGLISFWADRDTDNNNKPLIGLPFVLLSLSFIWSNRFQEAIAKSNHKNKKVTARYKSGECFVIKLKMERGGGGCRWMYLRDCERKLLPHVTLAVLMDIL